MSEGSCDTRKSKNDDKSSNDAESFDLNHFLTRINYIKKIKLNISQCLVFLFKLTQPWQGENASFKIINISMITKY